MPAQRPRPAEYRLDAPPTTDEGSIINVEHDHTNARFRNAPDKTCQQCAATVDRRTPHTTAFIRVHSSLGPKHKRPVFCDVDCWLAFATGGAQG
jgi:hypothetical protein